MHKFKNAIDKISYVIDMNHQREWFTKAMLPLT